MDMSEDVYMNENMAPILPYKLTKMKPKDKYPMENNM
jgi:hypothetical protein